MFECAQKTSRASKGETFFCTAIVQPYFLNKLIIYWGNFFLSLKPRAGDTYGSVGESTAFAALAEDQSLVPSTHTGWIIIGKSQDALLASVGTPVCVAYTLTDVHVYT